MLTIELRRAITPEQIGEQRCALCGTTFWVEAVYAWPTNGSMEIDGSNPAACLECVAYFGRRDPERFPTIEEYEQAARSYPEPIVGSIEEMMRLEIEDDEKAHEVYAASEIR